MSKSPSKSRNIKSLKELSFNNFLENKVGKTLTVREINRLYNHFGFEDGVYYLTNTSGYVIDEGKLHTWDVEYYFYKSGQIKAESWHKDGKLDRVDRQPAYLYWYKNGNIKQQNWYKNDYFIEMMVLLIKLGMKMVKLK